MIKWTIAYEADYTLVHFKLDDVITPDLLRDIKPPRTILTKGVALSGRAPIWLYGYLVHHYHPNLWVATYDPRLGGAVVVSSHTRLVKCGDVIEIEEEVE